MASKKPKKYIDIIDKKDTDIFDREEARLWWAYNRDEDFEYYITEILDKELPKSLDDKYYWFRNGMGSFSSGFSHGKVCLLFNRTIPEKDRKKASEDEITSLKKIFAKHNMEFIPTLNAKDGLYFDIRIAKKDLINSFPDDGDRPNFTKRKFDNLKKEIALKHNIPIENIEVYRNNIGELTYKINQNISESIKPMSAKEAINEALILSKEE